MSEKIYAKGINTFAKNEKAPDFVLGTIVINLNSFKEWINGEGRKYLSDYKGSPQLKLQVLQGKERLNILVDTFQPKKKEEIIPGNTVEEQAEIEKTFPKNDDLPF